MRSILPRSVAGILRVVVGIVAAAAVADTYIEIPVRTERDVAAVVVPLWMQDEALAAGPQ